MEVTLIRRMVDENVGSMMKVAKLGIGSGPTLLWRTVMGRCPYYGSGQSTELVEMGIVRVCP